MNRGLGVTHDETPSSLHGLLGALGAVTSWLDACGVLSAALETDDHLAALDRIIAAERRRTCSISDCSSGAPSFPTSVGCEIPRDWRGPYCHVP